MSYNGSGTFQINTSGQPVVAGTVISSTAFNALTADLATGLSTAITKDGQTTTTARIPFAAGINSSLATDSSSTSTGSIITAGGVGIAKALYVGTTANIGGTTDSSSVSTGTIVTAGGVGIAKNLYVGGSLNLTGSASFTNPVINNIKMGYSTTVTAAGTTTLTVSSNYRQFFTGSTTQTIVLPVTSTLVAGMAFEIENNSTGLLTVNSSGGNLVGTIPAGVCAHAVCIGTTLTTAADWDWDYISTSTITGTGANVLGTSPTITTPTISSLSSAAATALTLQSAGSTAITVDTSQNVGIGTTSPSTYSILTAYGSSASGFAGVTAINGAGSSGFGGIQMGSDSTYVKAAIALKREQANGGGSLVFYNSSSSSAANWATTDEKMRIDFSGNLLVGTTATNVTSGGYNFLINDGGTGYSTGYIGHITGCPSGYAYLNFKYAGTTIGTITQNGTTAVAYNTSSDYRLKNTIAPMTGALAKVAQLKPVTYKWNADDSDGEGFIAHELAEVCPHAVTGAKDAVDADGNPVYQGIDTSFLVATLTAAIQEQQTLITALTARITALETK